MEPKHLTVPLSLLSLQLAKARGTSWPAQNLRRCQMLYSLCAPDGIKNVYRVFFSLGAGTAERSLVSCRQEKKNAHARAEPPLGVSMGVAEGEVGLSVVIALTSPAWDLTQLNYTTHRRKQPPGCVTLPVKVPGMAAIPLGMVSTGKGMHNASTVS